MVKLVLAGWKPGLNKIELTRAFRQYCGLSLPDAKANTDLLIEDTAIELVFDDHVQAEQFAKRVKELGVATVTFARKSIVNA